MRAIERAQAHEPDVRIAVCEPCRERDEATECTHGEVWEACEMRQNDDESVSCKRIKSMWRLSCTKKSCMYAHAAELLPTASLTPWSRRSKTLRFEARGLELQFYDAHFLVSREKAE